MADEPVMTPITPDEGATAIPPKATPFAPKPLAPAPAEASAPAAPAAPATPAAPAASAAPAATVRLKPVIRKPMIHKPVVGGARPPATPAPVAPAPAAAAAAPKKATQNLKSVTGPIPAQAVLRKTGIIAEGILTPAQQQAAKSKTSRISLESAIGVDAAPAATPLKTIRLRRPTDLKPQPLKPAAPAPLTPAPAADAPATPDPAAAPAAEPAPSTTQKRTLKLHRPAMGVKPPAPTMGAAPAENAVPDVADIADIPDLPTLGAESAASGGAQSAGVPTWVAAISLVTSIAALLVVSTLVYFFCKEGIAPDGQEANANTSYVISL